MPRPTLIAALLALLIALPTADGGAVDEPDLPLVYPATDYAAFAEDVRASENDFDVQGKTFTLGIPGPPRWRRAFDLVVEGALDRHSKKRVVKTVAEELELRREAAVALVDAIVASWPVSANWFPASPARDRRVRLAAKLLRAAGAQAPEHVALAQEVAGGLYNLMKFGGLDRSILMDYVLEHPVAYALASFFTERELVDRVILEHPDRVGIQAIRLYRRHGALDLEPPHRTSRLELVALTRRLGTLLEANDTTTSDLTAKEHDRLWTWTAQLAFASLFETGMPSEALAAIDALPARLRPRAVTGPPERTSATVDGVEIWFGTIDLRLEVAVAMALAGRAEEAGTLAASMMQVLCWDDAEKDHQGYGRNLPALIDLIDALTGNPPSDLFRFGSQATGSRAASLFLAIAHVAEVEDMPSMQRSFLREALHEMVLHRGPAALAEARLHGVDTQVGMEHLKRAHAAAIAFVEDAIIHLTPPNPHAREALDRLVEATVHAAEDAAIDSIDAKHVFGPHAARAFESDALDTDGDGIADARDQTPLTPRRRTEDTAVWPLALALHGTLDGKGMMFDRYDWTKYRPVIVVAEDHDLLGLLRPNRRTLILDPGTAILLRRQVLDFVGDIRINHFFDRAERRSVVWSQSPHADASHIDVDRLVTIYNLAVSEDGLWRPNGLPPRPTRDGLDACDQLTESNAE